MGTNTCECAYTTAAKLLDRINEILETMFRAQKISVEPFNGQNRWNRFKITPVLNI